MVVRSAKSLKDKWRPLDSRLVEPSVPLHPDIVLTAHVGWRINNKANR